MAHKPEQAEYPRLNTKPLCTLLLSPLHSASVLSESSPNASCWKAQYSAWSAYAGDVSAMADDLQSKERVISSEMGRISFKRLAEM